MTSTISREAQEGLVFALDTCFNVLHVFETKTIVVDNIEGIEVAEGDWKFFFVGWFGFGCKLFRASADQSRNEHLLEWYLFSRAGFGRDASRFNPEHLVR
jgi:hypothetical protein